MWRRRRAPGGGGGGEEEREHHRRRDAGARGPRCGAGSGGGVGEEEEREEEEGDGARHGRGRVGNSSRSFLDFCARKASLVRFVVIMSWLKAEENKRANIHNIYKTKNKKKTQLGRWKTDRVGFGPQAGNDFCPCWFVMLLWQWC